MFKQIIPLVMVCSACTATDSDVPPPEWLVGQYQYSGNGTFARKFPWQAKADLVLDKDGQYTFTMNVHINDEKGGDTDADESYGTYRVDGNRLVLKPADGDESGDTHEFEIRGRRLIPKFGWPTRLAMRGFRIPDPQFVKSE